MPNDILEALNAKLHEEQMEQGKLRYSVMKESTMPALRNALLLSGITESELSRFDTFLGEVFDICEKYLGKDE